MNWEKVIDTLKVFLENFSWEEATLVLAILTTLAFIIAGMLLIYQKNGALLSIIFEGKKNDVAMDFLFQEESLGDAP